MRIGIIGDTRNRLDNVKRIVEILNAAGVEAVVHTGDITEAPTLHAFAGLEAPLFGVYGNDDREREGLEQATGELGMRFVDAPLRLAWGERRVVVVHDPIDLDARMLADCDVALHGRHPHPGIERRHGALVVGSGPCAAVGAGANSVGVLDLASLSVERLEF